MKIEKILKQLTPEKAQKEIRAIHKIKLPPEFQRWVNEYEKVGARDEFFWKFMYKINQTIRPFNIPKKYQNSIIKVKFLTVMFIILLDDIADKAQSKKLLNEILKIPFSQNYIKKEKKYSKFSLKIWRQIVKTIKKYPRYKKFKEIFEYDISQVLNAMKYSYLVNETPYLVNKSEYWLYSPHTLQGMINCTLDLMCFPKFNIKELSKIREAFWKAQKMARIANCLSTWRRELHEGDLTGGLVAYAISLNLLNVEDFNKKNKSNIIKKIDQSNIKKKLLKEWQQCHDEIYFLCREIKPIKSNIFLSQLERLFLMYLITEKYNQ